MHAFEPPEHGADFAQIQPRQRGFDPLVSVLAIAVLRLGHTMQIFSTVVVVQNLTGTRKERLDVFPYPGGAVTDDTKPDAIFGNQACLLDLFEGLTEFGFILYLMPTE